MNNEKDFLFSTEKEQYNNREYNEKEEIDDFSNFKNSLKKSNTSNSTEDVSVKKDYQETFQNYKQIFNEKEEFVLDKKEENLNENIDNSLYQNQEIKNEVNPMDFNLEDSTFVYKDKDKEVIEGEKSYVTEINQYNRFIESEYVDNTTNAANFNLDYLSQQTQNNYNQSHNYNYQYDNNNNFMYENQNNSSLYNNFYEEVNKDSSNVNTFLNKEEPINNPYNQINNDFINLNKEEFNYEENFIPYENNPYSYENYSQNTYFDKDNCLNLNKESEEVSSHVNANINEYDYSYNNNGEVPINPFNLNKSENEVYENLNNFSNENNNYQNLNNFSNEETNYQNYNMYDNSLNYSQQYNNENIPNYSQQYNNENIPNYNNFHNENIPNYNNFQEEIEPNNEVRKVISTTAGEESIGEIASLELRKKAYILDKTIFLIPTLALYLVFLNPRVLEAIITSIRYSFNISIVLSLISPIIGFIVLCKIAHCFYYVVIPVCFRGQTFGKKKYNLRIVTTDINSPLVPLETLFKREFVYKFKSSIFFKGYLRAMKSNKNIMDYDLKSNTRVIYEKEVVINIDHGIDIDNVIIEKEEKKVD